MDANSCSDPLAELIEWRRQRRAVNFHSLGVPVVVIRRGDHQRNDTRAGANIQWNPSQQYRQASESYERALALAPGNTRALSGYARFAVLMGRTDAGIAAGRRAVVLDPLNPYCHYRLGDGLLYARHYKEAVAAYDAALALEPDNARTHGFRGLAYYALGDLQSARASCEVKPGTHGTG